MQIVAPTGYGTLKRGEVKIQLYLGLSRVRRHPLALSCHADRQQSARVVNESSVFATASGVKVVAPGPTISFEAVSRGHEHMGTGARAQCRRSPAIRAGERPSASQFPFAHVIMA